MNRPDSRNQDQFRSAVTMTVIWVAGLTLAVIFAALFAGIALDKLLHTGALLTILLTVASIPLTIYLTFRVVKTATKNLQPTAKKEIPKEELDRGNDD
jgi:ABC-type sugar transport system permease subunit